MRKIFYNGIFFIALLFLSFSVSAQDDDILSKLQSAVDPKGILASSKTKISSGTVEIPILKIKAEVISYYKKPDKYRIDTILEDGTREIRSYDGEKAFKWNSNENTIKEIEGSDKKAIILSAYLQNPDMQFWNKEIFSFVEEKDLKVSCTLKKEFGFDLPVCLYIDRNTFLISQMDMPTVIMGNELNHKITIKSYRKKGNYLVAENVSSSILGAEMNYHLTNISLNEDIEDSFFTEIDK
ncbi:MAG TPA: hypothetical protein DD381_08460 [Lentisphaeria bacterium]|nr:MAG: hypothetical protein A2X47_11230 [Lentisphaerae bacterium GWF2_38_69]HBM16354.1 hypothetical protein [Lentisphaeria bacterium]